MRCLTIVIPAFVSASFEEELGAPFDNLWLDKPDPELIARLTVVNPLVKACVAQALRYGSGFPSLYLVYLTSCLSIHFWLMAKAAFAVSFTVVSLSLQHFGPQQAI